eukprot:NODE_501_length_1865_cov_51.333142_g493_i0.p1 GENE.NODE_501_length_1865_cov_51.333142_g493_i0~~NODE_501_length_1865_cov_51.333142_g493_i0.p1  ORF type:complete len:583 (-),score=79.03 NODE_501_length_1865_cov_51.333142_g493_i0:57-1805(-)
MGGVEPKTICFACRHQFTSEHVTSLQLSPEIVNSMLEYQDCMAKAHIASGKGRQATLLLEEAFKKLIVTVEGQFTDLKGQIATLTAEREDHEEFLRERADRIQREKAQLEEEERQQELKQRQLDLYYNRQKPSTSAVHSTTRPQQKPANVAAAHGHGQSTVPKTPRGTERLHNPFSAANIGGKPAAEPATSWPTSWMDDPPKSAAPHPPSISHPLRRRGAPVSSPPSRQRRPGPVFNRSLLTSSGTISSAPGPSITLNESLSTTVYLVLEALSSAVRAQRGVLWFRSEFSDELVASVLVGTKIMRGMKPFRIPSSSGVAGAVTTTGVAVNACSHDDDNPIDANVSVLPDSARCLLCLPIFRRYQQANRATIGCIQLINKNGGMGQFTPQDETLVYSTAQLLSHILSTYQDTLTEMEKKVFDPAALAKRQTYSTANASVEAVPSKIIGHYPAQLIYRAMGYLAAKEMQSTKTYISTEGRLKEVDGEITHLEASWKNSVAEVEDLRRLLEGRNREVMELQNKSGFLPATITPLREASADSKRVTVADTAGLASHLGLRPATADNVALPPSPDPEAVMFDFLNQP